MLHLIEEALRDTKSSKLIYFVNIDPVDDIPVESK